MMPSPNISWIKALQRGAVDLCNLVEAVDQRIDRDRLVQRTLGRNGLERLRDERSQAQNVTAASASAADMVCWPSSADVTHTGCRPTALAICVEGEILLRLRS